MLQFSCNRQAFANILSNVARGAANKSTIPELQCIQMQLRDGVLTMTGYDLELGIRSTITVVSQDTGAFCVSPRLLSGAVARCWADEVRLTLDEENYMLHFLCGDTKLQLPAMSAAEYPTLPEVQKENAFSLPQKTLSSMIRQTKYAASVSEARPILMGELFETKNGVLTVVAVDGYRLAVRYEPVDCKKDLSFVVPKNTLDRVLTLLGEGDASCTVSPGTRTVMFEVGDYTIFSRLLEGNFLRYENSIPQRSETTVRLSALDLQRCLERCALLISGKYNAPVECTFAENALLVRCKTALGEIEDKIPAQIDGPSLTIGFDNRYFLEAVRAADCDEVRMLLTEPNRVAEILPPQGEKFLFLLMPIQLKKRG